MSDMLEIIKKAALDAVEQSKPVAIVFGVVESTAPLRVKVEQKLTLSRDFLILTDRASDLHPGDSVVMLQRQGGQKYLILDKVVT